MSGWKYAKTIAWLLAVFAAGLVVGGVVTVRVIQHQYRERMNAATWTPRTVAWLQTTLRLSPEQESQIQPVVERWMEKMVGLRTRVVDERKQLFGHMFAELATHLTDEQRQQLQRAIQEAVAKESPYSAGEHSAGGSAGEP